MADRGVRVGRHQPCRRRGRERQRLGHLSLRYARSQPEPDRRRQRRRAACLRQQHDARHERRRPLCRLHVDRGSRSQESQADAVRCPRATRCVCQGSDPQSHDARRHDAWWPTAGCRELGAGDQRRRALRGVRVYCQEYRGRRSKRFGRRLSRRPSERIPRTVESQRGDSRCRQRAEWQSGPVRGRSIRRVPVGGVRSAVRTLHQGQRGHQPAAGCLPPGLAARHHDTGQRRRDRGMDGAERRARRRRCRRARRVLVAAPNRWLRRRQRLGPVPLRHAVRVAGRSACFASARTASTIAISPMPFPIEMFWRKMRSTMPESMPTISDGARSG